MAGAHRMAHMLSLRENGELFERLQNCHVPSSFPAAVSSNAISLPEVPGDWMQAHLPAIIGPYSSRPWVGVLLGYCWTCERSHKEATRCAY